MCQQRRETVNLIFRRSDSHINFFLGNLPVSWSQHSLGSALASTLCDCHLCSANTQVSEEGSALLHLISSLGDPFSTLLLTGCQRHSGFVAWPCATGLVTLPEHLSLIGLTAAGPYVIAAISLPPLPGGCGAAGQRQQRLRPASPCPSAGGC